MLPKKKIQKEFVVDIDPTNNQKIPRYLIYDIIKFEVIS